MLDVMRAKCRTLIVEDNPASLNEFKNALSHFTDLDLIGEAYDGPKAVHLIDTLKPDLIFLDIQLPEMDGFDVLKSIQHVPLVIFISAYDHYALKAFEANGIDYILKPFGLERLRQAIDKALNRKRHTQNDLMAMIQNLIEEKKRQDRRFAVKYQEQILIIPQEEITFFKAEDKYVFLHTRDKNYFYNATLKELETSLNPNMFGRVNKSFIVAFDKIEKVKKSFDQGYKLIMKDEQKTTVKVSKTHLENVKKQLNIR